MYENERVGETHLHIHVFACRLVLTQRPADAAEHVNVANCYKNLGSVYQKLGHFEQAKEFHHRALDIQLKKLGPEHVNVAYCYSNLGSVYQNLSRFEQAKELHHRALDIQLKKLGPENADVATSYSLLGSVYQGLGDFEEAKELHQRDLNIKLKKLGPEHVNVSTSHSFLGSVELPPFSESNNPSGVMEQKQRRRLRSKRCRIL